MDISSIEKINLRINDLKRKERELTERIKNNSDEYFSIRFKPKEAEKANTALRQELKDVRKLLDHNNEFLLHFLAYGKLAN